MGKKETFLLLALVAFLLSGCMMMHGHGMESRGENSPAVERRLGDGVAPRHEHGKAGPDREEKDSADRQGKGPGRRGLWILGGMAMAAMMILMML